MPRKKFKLWHSIAGLAALIVFEGILTSLWPVGATAWLLLAIAAGGALGTIYVATEVIEEVRNARHMLGLLFAVVAEFVVFFAVQYCFLLQLSPGSFPTLPQDGISVTLQSLMVFVFNPLHLAENALGQMLLIINTATALGLVLFILQNIWQIRRPAN